MLVVNTHLYSQPERPEIRLVQLVCILQHIEHLTNAIRQREHIDSFQLGVVVCGDFNSQPKDALHTLMINEHVPAEIKHMNFSHPFKFISAYPDAKYTHFTPNLICVLDYIYFNCCNLRLIQVNKYFGF